MGRRPLEGPGGRRGRAQVADRRPRPRPRGVRCTRRRLPLEASDRPFAYGDGPLARLDPATLPDDRAGIARVLNRGIRTDRWGPYASSRGRRTGIPEHIQRSHTAYSMVLLLVYARLTADQRAALLDVLATHAAARDLGHVDDAIRRPGRAVRLDFPPPTPYSTPAPAEQISLVFDPVTSEILEWSMTPPDGPSRSAPVRREIVLETGWAQHIGERTAP